MITLITVFKKTLLGEIKAFVNSFPKFTLAS